MKKAKKTQLFEEPKNNKEEIEMREIRHPWSCQKDLLLKISQSEITLVHLKSCHFYF